MATDSTESRNSRGSTRKVKEDKKGTQQDYLIEEQMNHNEADELLSFDTMLKSQERNQMERQQTCGFILDQSIHLGSSHHRINQYE